MKGKPKPLINLGASCFLNVGFQVWVSRKSLKGLFDNEVLDDNDHSELSLLKKELYKILYDKNTRSCKYFIDIWSGQIHNKIKVIEPTVKDLDPNPELQTPLRTLGNLPVDPLKPGIPINTSSRYLPNDLEPRVAPPRTYIEYIHLTDDFLLIKNEMSLGTKDPFKRFIVIMIEASCDAEEAEKVLGLKERHVYAPKSVELDFSKKLTMEPKFSRDR